MRAILLTTVEEEGACSGIQLDRLPSSIGRFRASEFLEARLSYPIMLSASPEVAVGHAETSAGSVYYCNGIPLVPLETVVIARRLARNDVGFIATFLPENVTLPTLLLAPDGRLFIELKMFVRLSLRYIAQVPDYIASQKVSERISRSTLEYFSAILKKPSLLTNQMGPSEIDTIAKLTKLAAGDYLVVDADLGNQDVYGTIRIDEVDAHGLARCSGYFVGIERDIPIGTRLHRRLEWSMDGTSYEVAGEVGVVC